MMDFSAALWQGDDFAALAAHLRGELAEEGYRRFHSSLLPGVEDVLGVRVPLLRALAKQIARGDFRAYLAGAYAHAHSYEETLLAGLVTGYARMGLGEALDRIAAYVPHISNWALCDVAASTFKILTKDPVRGLDFAAGWMARPGEYDKRFGAVCLLDFFVTEAAIDRVLALLDGTRHEGYYYKMAAAWALSVCFVKFRDKTLALFEENHLDDFTHNKALQKCRESYRVSAQDKALLLTLKRKGAQSAQ